MLCIDHAAPPNPHALGLVTGPTENREGYCRGTSKGCPLSYSEACKCTHGTSAGAGSQIRGSPGPYQLSEDWGNTWVGVRGSPCMGWGAWITMDGSGCVDHHAWVGVRGSPCALIMSKAWALQSPTHGV